MGTDGGDKGQMGGDWRVIRDKEVWWKFLLLNDTNKLYLFKNIILYDNNIINVSLQSKVKKETKRMGAKCTKNFRSRGGTNVMVGRD